MGITVYILVHIATFHIFVNVIGKPHKKAFKDPEVLEKYYPFNRNDVDKMDIVKCFPFYITFWPRILSMIFNCFCYTCLMLVLMIGVGSAENVTGLRKFLIEKMGRFHCRLHALIAGLIWVSPEYVDADYSKWLGPDWKPNWGNSGTIVFNHVSWMDIMIGIAYWFPSFVSKQSVKNYPGVGIIAQGFGCLFLDRAGTKEEKAKIAKIIEERQEQNIKGERPPLIIYPEGATTNNECLIKFKRGPFGSGKSVQPVCLKYWSPNGISPQNDTFSALHFYFCYLSPFITCRMKIYPVFEPNQFFWDNHWDEASGEKQWQAYSRVIRDDIMAKSFDFRLFECYLESKFELKELFKPSKKKAAHNNG